MRVANGRVIEGKVVLEGTLFTDGTHVVVISRDDDKAVRLSPEELAELEAGIAEADRGEMISGQELFSRLARYK